MSLTKEELEAIEAVGEQLEKIFPEAIKKYCEAVEKS